MEHTKVAMKSLIKKPGEDVNYKIVHCTDYWSSLKMPNVLLLMPKGTEMAAPSAAYIYVQTTS